MHFICISWTIHRIEKQIKECVEHYDSIKSMHNHWQSQISSPYPYFKLPVHQIELDGATKVGESWQPGTQSGNQYLSLRMTQFPPHHQVYLSN